ncbi:hypothetical protein QZH41_012139, partial [Actinostola sp. cb2023]
LFVFFYIYIKHATERLIINLHLFQGYVVVQSFFTKEELQPVIESINEIVDDVAEKLYKAGKISNKHVGATFYNRLTLLEKEFPGAAVLVHKKGILPKAFQDFWSNERLLNVVEQMIGTEICGHPVWNLRSKSLMYVVCKRRFNAHQPKRNVGTYDSQRCVDMQKDIVLCEVPMGGILFINNLLPHRSFYASVGHHLGLSAITVRTIIFALPNYDTTLHPLTRSKMTAKMAERFSKTPEIYTTIPPQPKEKKPDSAYLYIWFQGYVVVRSFFTKGELQPVIESINEIVDDVAEKLYKAGKISNKHEGATFYDRLTLLEKEFPGAAILVIKKGILPEVPKNDQVTVPWHQDNSYFSDEANELLMPTAWIPFIDACKLNGCMEVGKGGHKKGYLAKHYCCAGPTLYVELKEENMFQDLGVDMQKDIVLCEVPMGGILFINNLVPHRSLQNHSQQIRWSVDLRWCVPDKPNGFYDLKDSVLMHTAKDPEYKIDWERFVNTDRHSLEAGDTNESQNRDEDEFDPTIIGPWMGKWEIIHHNKHTERYLENEERIKAKAIIIN